MSTTRDPDFAYHAWCDTHRKYHGPCADQGQSDDSNASVTTELLAELNAAIAPEMHAAIAALAEDEER